ncbi:MAG: glycosyltransferase, partial [Chloroflexi bacterium]|nr:glycosyltransferase [Chloroflexota bacterium]
MTPPFDICMFVHNDVSGDGRVLKEAACLAAAGWRVAVVGVSLGGAPRQTEESVSGFTIFRVTPRLLRRQMPGSWGKLLRLLVAIPAIARQIRRTKARVFHGNDFIGLIMLALAGIRRRPVVYDSHELFFDRWPKGARYPLKYPLYTLRPLEKILARRAAGVLTVSEPIADRLAQTLGIPRPIVLQNAVDLRHAGPPVAFSAGGRKIVA